MLTVIIAAYAALVSSAGVGWQIYSWRQTHKTRVRVTVANAVIPLLHGDVQRVVSVGVVNDSGHQVRVTGFGLLANDGSGQQLFFISPVPGSSLPGVVQPHDSGTGLNDWRGLFGAPIDFSRPVEAFAMLASGERVRSKPVTLYIPEELRAA